MPDDLADLRLLNVEQVCELLGVTREWVYDAVEAKRLPAVRLPGGRLLRFRLADLKAMLEDGRIR